MNVVAVVKRVQCQGCAYFKSAIPEPYNVLAPLALPRMRILGMCLKTKNLIIDGMGKKRCGFSKPERSDSVLKAKHLKPEK